MKAQRTREQIIDVALDLFIEQGYDETTMEQIAERAEVGSSTLYRYFPSKDLLILDRLVHGIDLGTRLRTRPAEEPLDLALGAVVLEALSEMDDGDGRFAALRRIIDRSPVPRARLWDFVAQLRTGFEEAIAERMGRAPDDVSVMLAARIAFSIYELAGETWWAGNHDIPSADVVAEVLRSIVSIPVIVPRLPPRE